ncbi:MAG: CHAD domain-containing protein [Steroidobacterales bacterium]
MTDGYLDTGDARLARAGYALRLRTHDSTCEATLKGLQQSHAGAANRREISQPFHPRGEDGPQAGRGPVVDRVRAVIGHEPLQMLFVARTHRDVYRVLEGDVEAAEIDLDATEIRGSGPRPPRRLQRVEVELRNAKRHSLEPLVRQLRERAALEPVAASKYEVGMNAAGRSLPAPPEPGTLAILPTEAAVVAGRMLLRRQLDAWRHLEPSVRLAEDPEALHRLRVTGRRLIAVLRLLEATPVDEARGLRKHMQDLLRRTSAVRDLDVRIAEFGAANRIPRNQSLQSLVDELVRQRARQQVNLLRVLDSARTARLFAALDRLCAHRSQVHSRRTVAQVAGQLIRRRYRKLRKVAAHVIRNPDAHRCHAMRLETKNLRYLAEMLGSTYGTPMRRFVRRLQKLQSVLGRINDAHQALGFLELPAQRRCRSLSPQVAIAMTHLRRRHSRHLTLYLGQLPEVWSRASGKRWQRLRKSLYI